MNNPTTPPTFVPAAPSSRPPVPAGQPEHVALIAGFVAFGVTAVSSVVMLFLLTPDVPAGFMFALIFVTAYVPIFSALVAIVVKIFDYVLKRRGKKISKTLASILGFVFGLLAIPFFWSMVRDLGA